MKWLAILLLSLPCWATWANQQVEHCNAACTAASSTCSVTTSATTAGTTLYAALFTPTDASITISSISGDGTWTHCSNSAGTDNGASADMSYRLLSTGGTTSFTITASSAPAHTWAACIGELSHANTAAVDTSGGRLQSTGQSTPLPGVTLTLTGSNDAVIQIIMNSSGNATGINSGSYVIDAGQFSPTATAHLFNTTDGTATQWTVNTSSRAVLAALAFTEVSGVSQTKKKITWY